MAIARPVNGHVEYAVPQATIDAAPEGTIYAHFAWFHRRSGRWIGEWAGYVPPPRFPRIAWLRNKWAWCVQAGLSPDRSAYETLDEEWDLDAWHACRPGEAVGLEVSQFGWPIGDQRYHVFRSLTRMLDWPSMRRYIEAKTSTGEIVANQESSRPLREAVPGQRVIDITGTPLEQHHGRLFGRIVRGPDGYRIERLGGGVIRAVLVEASPDLDQIIHQPARQPAQLRRGSRHGEFCRQDHYDR